jgi:hypothetical protein
MEKRATRTEKKKNEREEGKLRQTKLERTLS